MDHYLPISSMYKLTIMEYKWWNKKKLKNYDKY